MVSKMDNSSLDRTKHPMEEFGITAYCSAMRNAERNNVKKSLKWRTRDAFRNTIRVILQVSIETRQKLCMIPNGAC